MQDPSTPIDRAKSAARIATLVFFGVIGFSVLRALFSPTEPGKSQFDWNVTLRFSVVIGMASFVAIFTWMQATATRGQPALDILTEGISTLDRSKVPMWGFVAMEYYWLVMNRTYVIFIAPEGLYGWLAQGPVAAPNSTYFEPYQRMLLDERLMRNHAAIQKLSGLPGGFFIGRSEIESVADDDLKKWGMGELPHTGNIRVRLISGMTREFIVLGNVNTGRVRHKIISVVGVQASPDA